MAQKKSKKARLEETVREIVGFGAVSDLGYKLSETEIKTISEYVSSRGGNSERAELVLREKGRPFSVGDLSFRARCLICNSLRNYCCC